MLNLKRRSTFNFYESFSDLIFCTLVLFLVLILFLAINVNKQVYEVKEVKQDYFEKVEVTERLMAEIEAEEKELLARRDSLEKQTTELLNQEKELQERSLKVDTQLEYVRQVEQEYYDYKAQHNLMVGRERYTGQKGISSYAIAVDVRMNTPVVYLIPNDLINECVKINSSKNVEGQIDKIFSELQRVKENIKPITPEELSTIMSYTSISLVPTFSQDPECLMNTLSSDILMQILCYPIVQYYKQSGSPIVKMAGMTPDQMIGPDSENNFRRAYPKVLQNLSIAVETQIGETSITDVWKITPGIKANTIHYRTSSICSEYFSGIYGSHGQELVSPQRIKKIREQIDNFEELFFRKYCVNNDNVPATSGLPTLFVSVDSDNRQVVIGEHRFTKEMFSSLLESVGGAGIALEFQSLDGRSPALPQWVVSEILIPNGFYNKSPEIAFYATRVD